MSKLSQVLTLAVGDINTAGAFYSERMVAQKSSYGSNFSSRRSENGQVYAAKEAAITAEISARIDDVLDVQTPALAALADLLGQSGDVESLDTVFGMSAKIAAAKGSWELLMDNQAAEWDSDFATYEVELGSFGSVDLDEYPTYEP